MTSVVIKESEQHVTLCLPAKLDNNLQMEFQHCYRNRPSGPGISYEIDFQEVHNIDSSVLGMLLLMRNYCGEEEADIQLINCSPIVKKILHMTRFNTMFRIG